MGLCRKLKDLRKNIDGLSLKATLMYVKSLPGYSPQTGDSTGFGVTAHLNKDLQKIVCVYNLFPY